MQKSRAAVLSHSMIDPQELLSLGKINAFSPEMGTNAAQWRHGSTSIDETRRKALFVSGQVSAAWGSMIIAHQRNTSGRRRGRPRRPPTPPDVRFRIRRFMKYSGSAAEFPAAKLAPSGQTRFWDRLGSYGTRLRSTRDHVHWWSIATPVAFLSPCPSGSSPV